VQAATGLQGPFALTSTNVRALPNTPGVYVLSNPGRSGPLACYVGRSADLRRRLASHVGNYKTFYVKYTATEAGAFFTECRLFHQYGKARYLDNVNHPAVPARSSLPPCSESGCRGEAY